MTDTAVIMTAGFALAVLSFIWIWHDKPDIVEKLYRRVDAMQQEIDELRAAMTNDRETMSEMRAIMTDWQQGMPRVFAQMKEAKLVPVWTPKEIEYRPKVKRPESSLANRIADRFNIDEINSLAYDIGILSDEFGGETKEARARELVELAFRRGISAALLGRVNELRREP